MPKPLQERQAYAGTLFPGGSDPPAILDNCSIGSEGNCLRLTRSFGRAGEVNSQVSTQGTACIEIRIADKYFIDKFSV